MPFYLRPSAPTAADALICGDPARALAIAQHVMVQPRMSNHNRGLWGYYGETPGGLPLTVQATGIGGPSAVAVLREAIELGVRRVIRVGTCAATAADRGSARAGSSRTSSPRTVRADPSAPGSRRGHPGRLRTRPRTDRSARRGDRIRGTTVRSVDVITAGATPAVDPGEGRSSSTCRRRPCSPSPPARRPGRRRGDRQEPRRATLHDDPLDAALLRLADGGVVTLEALTKLSMSS